MHPWFFADVGSIANYAAMVAILVTPVVLAFRYHARKLAAQEREREREHEIALLVGHSPTTEAEGIKLRLEALEAEMAALKGVRRIPSPVDVPEESVMGDQSDTQVTF